MKVGGGTTEEEVKNCTMSSMQFCNSAFCEGVNATGNAIECQVSCCEGDLCNGGDGPMPTQVPATSGGPSGMYSLGHNTTEEPVYIYINPHNTNT